MLKLAATSLLLGAAVAAPHRDARHNRGLHARVPLPEESDDPDLFFTQQTDHFNYASRVSGDYPANTWSQRYQMNTTFATEGGPVFLLWGGEGSISEAWLTYPTNVMANAEEFGATVFQLEHRFYGPTSDVSQPTGDMTTESLGLLSSQQALADGAAFATAMSDLYGLTGPWVSFGGSYSGNLAAWSRLKYPHIFAGASAWSAPVLAELDYDEYMGVVSNGIQWVDDQQDGGTCLQTVAAGTVQVHDKLANKEFADIESDFKLCEPLQSKQDRQNFMEILTGAWADGAQYGHDNRGFEGGDPITTLEQLCAIVDAADSPYDALAAVNARFLDDMGAPCQDASYDGMIQYLSNTTVEGGGAGRAWTWQTAAEFSYLQTSDSPHQPFGTGFPLDFFLDQYPAIFDGVTCDQSTIDATNTYYGARDFTASNVLFLNGKQDPWHALSIVEGDDLPEGSSAVWGGHVAHCAGMYPADESDPAELTAARKTETEAIKSWIA